MKIALLETSFKKDIQTLAGEYRARRYPASSFSNTTNRSISLNAISLCCGIVGNMFLLFNFTQIVRYIIALPVTIILWFISAGIVSDISPSLVLYLPGLTLACSYVELP